MDVIFNPYLGFLAFLVVMILFFFCLWLISTILDDIITYLRKWFKK